MAVRFDGSDALNIVPVRVCPAMHVGTPGMLTLLSQRIMWKADSDCKNAAVSWLEINFLDIEKLQSSLRTSTNPQLRVLVHPERAGDPAKAHVFQFETFERMDGMKAKFGEVLSHYRQHSELYRERALDSQRYQQSVQATQRMAGGTGSGSEMVLCGVDPLLLSDAAAATPAPSLAAAAAGRARAATLKPGMTSEDLADIRPDVQPGSCNETTYNFTSEIIEQIFRKNPVVLRLYRETVPEKKTEQEFWSSYVKSEYFHRSRNRNAAINLTDEFDIFHKAPHYEAMEQAESAEAPKRRPILDLSRNEFAPGSRDLFPPATPSLLPIVKNISKHADVVLGPPPTTPSYPFASRESDALLAGQLLDAASDGSRKLLPLDIRDSRVYFEGHAAPATATLAPLSNWYKFQNDLQKWKPNLRQRFVDRDHDEAAREVLRELSANSARDTHVFGMQPSSADKNGKLTDDPEFDVMLKSVFATVNQLLRHYWAIALALHPTSLPETPPDKLQRLYAALGTIYENLSATKERIPVARRNSLGSLLNPIIRCMDQAIEHYAACFPAWRT